MIEASGHPPICFWELGSLISSSLWALLLWKITSGHASPLSPVMTILVSTSILYYWIKLVQTCWNLSKLVETYWNSLKLFETRWILFKLVETRWNLLKLVQTCSNSLKLVETCLNSFKLAETCSNLFRILQTCSKVISNSKKNLWNCRGIEEILLKLNSYNKKWYHLKLWSCYWHYSCFSWWLF